MNDLIWLSKAQMRRIEPFFPLSHGVPRVDDRRVISGIIFVIRNGLRWRDAPAEYGPHKTIYNRFIRWSRLGVFNRIFAALAAKGGKPDQLMIDAKRVYRLYKEMGLQLRNKTPKRRVKAKLREDRTEASRANETWAMDFVHDQLATGRRIRVLTIVDTFTRYSPAVDPRFSYKGQDVVETLEHVCRQAGYPKTIRVDQGSEFISRDLDLWAYQKDVTLDFSRPGKPTDNAFIESFNGKFRAECLNVHWFMTLEDARTKMEDWRRDYNEVRPHSAIGNKPPITLVNCSSDISPP